MISIFIESNAVERPPELVSSLGLAATVSYIVVKL